MTAYFFMNHSSSDVSGDDSSTQKDQSAVAGLEGLTYIEDPKDFDGTKPIIKKMKETFSIAGTRYRNQAEGPRDAAEILVSWGGVLEFTVNEAWWFPSIEESGIDKNQLANPNTSLLDNPTPFVVVDVTINLTDGEGSLFGTDLFRLSAKQDYMLENFDDSEYSGLFAFLEYFSLHSEEDDYHTFNLPVNQDLNFKLGFFVTQETNKNELFLNLGGTNDLNLIGVRLDFSE